MTFGNSQLDERRRKHIYSYACRVLAYDARHLFSIMNSRSINEIVQMHVIVMTENVEAQMTAQIEAQMATMDVKLMKVYTASWKEKESLVEDDEVKDLGNDEVTDND